MENYDTKPKNYILFKVSKWIGVLLAGLNTLLLLGLQRYGVSRLAVTNIFSSKLVLSTYLNLSCNFTVLKWVRIFMVGR